MIGPGDRIERWELVRRLGAGGQAEVFEARHAELGSRAAVKILAPTASAERLLAEGRVLASLDHPNLVRVLDVVWAGDRPALVLEFVDGPTLAEVLAAGRPSWGELEPWLRQVMDGLAAAHARGVVHRDLKPSNVLLAESPAGRVAKVVDFGVARAPDGEQATRTGALLGTLRSMAPEQLRDASRADARADVWAMGVMIYECATGRPPFQGQDPIALHAAFLARDYPDPRSLAPALPPRVATAIQLALEPALERRLPDIATLRRALDGEPLPQAEPSESTWVGTLGGEDRPALAGLVLERRLDQDAAGERWLGRSSSGVPARITLAAPGEASERLEREAEALDTLPPRLRVPRRLGSGRLPDGRAWLARALPAGEPLLDWSGQRRTRVEVASLIAGALELAAELHALSPPVVVRDWSARTLVVGAGGEPWLAELARIKVRPDDPELGGLTFDGSAGDMAPEQLQGDSGPPSDVWGIGALAVGLLSRRDPAHLRRGSGFDLAPLSDLPPGWLELLRSQLAERPAERPSAARAAESWRRLAEAERARSEPSSAVAAAPRAPTAAPDPRPFAEPPSLADPHPEPFHQPPAVPGSRVPVAGASGPSAGGAPGSGWPVTLALLLGAALAFAVIALPTVYLLVALLQDDPAPPPGHLPGPTVGIPGDRSAPDLSEYEVSWSPESGLTVLRHPGALEFDLLPSVEKVEPLLRVEPRIRRPFLADQSCQLDLASQPDGSVAGVRVTGCVQEAAELSAEAAMAWRFEPADEMLVRHTRFRFVTRQVPRGP